MRSSDVLSDAKCSTRRRRAAARLIACLCLGLGAVNSAGAEAKTRSGLPPYAADWSSAAPQTGPTGFSTRRPSTEASQFEAWVIRTGDNQNLPFVIVDKTDAKVFVFDSAGRLLGQTSALLGLTRGDDSAPGIGSRPLAEIRPEERTTPAGRFVASLGYGLGKQDILWVDYNTSLALHRVLSMNSEEQRLQRLASPSPSTRRITFGCINVPANFYDAVVHPAFLKSNGIVYILPELKSMAEVFATYGAESR